MFHYYYAIAGSNGFGIFINHDEAVLHKEYLKMAKMFDPSSREEAFAKAVEYYNSFQDDERNKYTGDASELKPKRIFTTKGIRKRKCPIRFIFEDNVSIEEFKE